MLAISLTKWQKNSSGLWASPSPLAEGSSPLSGALVLCSLPRQHQGKLCKHSFRERLAVLQPYSAPAVAAGLMFPTSHPYSCTIRNKQHYWGASAKAGGCGTAKSQQQWVLVKAGLSVYLCFCQKMLPWGTLSGRHLQHLLVWVLPAGAHGDGARGQAEWKWLHFQPSSAGDWMCVSAGPWKGSLLTLLPE